MSDVFRLDIQKLDERLKVRFQVRQMEIMSESVMKRVPIVSASGLSLVW